jgi:hypothetical protein
LRMRRKRPRHSRSAEQSDELAAFQLIEWHSVPSQGRIAGYRIGKGQSGGRLQHPDLIVGLNGSDDELNPGVTRGSSSQKLG